MLLPENKPLGITVSLSHSQLQTQEHRQAAAVHTAPQAAGSFYIPAFLVSLDKPSPVKEGLKARLAAEGRWCVCVCVRVTAEAYFKGVLQLLLSTYVANVWTQCEQVTLPKSHEGDPLDTDSSRDRHETVQTHLHFGRFEVTTRKHAY